MQTPRLPQIKPRAFSWPKSLMSFAVVLVGLLHVWESFDEALNRGRGRQ